MRTYRKVWMNENLDVVTVHDPGTTGAALVALQLPHSKNQIINAYNFLAAGYVPRNAFGGAVWKLYEGGGFNLVSSFSGVQLANDVFSFVPYADHPLD